MQTTTHSKERTKTPERQSICRPNAISGVRFRSSLRFVSLRSVGFSALTRTLHLLRHGVEVGQKKPAKMVHLVGDLLGSVTVAVKSVVTIQSQLMSPGLQFGRNSMLCGKLVDSFFKLPCLDIRAMRLEPQLHRLSIHGASRVPPLFITVLRRLDKSPSHVLRDICRSRNHRWHGIDVEKPQIGAINQISIDALDSYRVYRVSIEGCQDRPPTRGTVCGDRNFTSSNFVPVRFPYVESRFCCTAIRAVKDDDWHFLLLPCWKGIFASKSQICPPVFMRRPA